MAKNKHKSDFDMGNVIKYLIKRSRILLSVTLLAFIVSVFVSFMLKPKYRSTAIVFPTSPASVAKSIMSTQYVTSRGADILNFGLEDECDQLLQVFLSRELKDSMNVKFGLMQHYGINPSDKYAMTRYYDAYDDNFRFRRSEYNSVIVNVYDTDPQLAATLTSEVVRLADSLYSRIVRERALKAFEVIKKEYQDMDSLIAAKERRLIELASMGVFKYDDQSKELTRAYYRALQSGKTEVANQIKKKMEIAQRYGVEYTGLHYDLRVLRIQRGDIHYKYTEARAALEQKLPNKFIVEHPIVADKKAWPRRSVIVITSTIGAFLFTLLLMVFIDALKKYI
ncbi:MAG: Wzz/FepE/Etk N-terminal domain-containing protein [Bacteroidales bacterium]|nr:Wzz/FepE/Etk N-terminal domain-containing protein [Bacteroidales bacterium]